tara:strand:+ start:45 stop:254 length:210 start_codon:yes stop_codon:yes gene_type:complete
MPKETKTPEMVTTLINLCADWDISPFDNSDHLTDVSCTVICSSDNVNNYTPTTLIQAVRDHFYNEYHIF